MDDADTITHETEGAREFLATRWTALRAKRKDVKDTGDGTISLSLEIAASDLPASYATSPDGSLWEVILGTADDEPLVFKATRHGIRDMAKGRIEIRLGTVLVGLPPERIYGQRGEMADVRLRLLAGRAPFPHLVDRPERAAVLRRAAVACADLQFGAWIAGRAEREGFPAIPPDSINAALDMPDGDYQTVRAGENLCRVARIHSRSEVLTSTAAAERVEALIRDYREDLWRERATAAGRERQERGLRA